jgi:C4-dicarboxylate-specific signal transduction histidine kinase
LQEIRRTLSELREAILDIVRDGKRAGEVIARIRALSRRTGIPSEKLNLNETIREVLVLVDDKAKTSGVGIRTQFAGDLSPVSGDRVQLQQVVLNLVMNAIEALSGVDEHARELLITTTNLDANQVVVTVRDSGPGLNPNAIGKIFEPFLHHQERRHGHGTLHLPFHRAEPRRPAVGFGKRWAWCNFSVHSSEVPAEGTHA